MCCENVILCIPYLSISTFDLFSSCCFSVFVLSHLSFLILFYLLVTSFFLFQAIQEYYLVYLYPHLTLITRNSFSKHISRHLDTIAYELCSHISISPFLNHYTISFKIWLNIFSITHLLTSSIPSNFSWQLFDSSSLSNHCTPLTWQMMPPFLGDILSLSSICP